MTTEALDAVHAIAEADPSWLDHAEYPFVPRYFGIDGYWMHYIDEGRHGEPLVFVHGTPTWSFLWRKMILGLHETHRCIAVDHLGFGLSDKPTDPKLLTPERHAKRLESLLLSLDLPKVTLVVHDFGGPIGLNFAVKHPESVKRVVIMNSWMWSTAEDPRALKTARFVKSGVGRFLYRFANLSPRRLMPSVFAKRRRLNQRIHSQYLGPFKKKEDRLAPWVLGCSLEDSNAFYAWLWQHRDSLEGISKLLLWGVKDPMFGEAARQRWQEAFPDADTYLCQHSGHFPQEEEPEVVIAELERFLDGTSWPSHTGHISAEAPPLH